jgi:(1->4)-alpha-D-glucan 1-alpha-D-glucosylmutase
MQIRRATYRVQLNGVFRLPDALALVPHFRALGVSQIYAAPLLRSKMG